MFAALGCRAQPAAPQPPIDSSVADDPPPPVAAVTPPPAAAPAPASTGTPVTLPVLDAMFADAGFAAALKTSLDLTDDQIDRLRTGARAATKSLMKRGEGSILASRHADELIRGVVGDDKTGRLAEFVRDYWTRDENGNPTIPSAEPIPGGIPTDTRIVVNAPAYRMDVFRDGALVDTYKIGIGYPEFPLPTGMRSASTIIFNPTWTPPDEPWVTGDVKAGERVAAGSKDNPLGAIKIPIGMPSLIHGGKSAANLGGFASHGCVGLTDAQVKTFAEVLAQISDTPLAPADVLDYEKDTKKTKRIALAATVPVELRYETIVVEAGKLRIYRDVYERGTNTEENLQRVLEASGVPPSTLSDEDRAHITTALQRMALAPDGSVVDTNPENAADEPAAEADGAEVTRRIKGAKVVEIAIPALAGKGYPAPHTRPRRGAGKPMWW